MFSAQLSVFHNPSDHSTGLQPNWRTILLLLEKSNLLYLPSIAQSKPAEDMKIWGRGSFSNKIYFYGKHFTSNQKTPLRCVVFAKECKCDNDPMWMQCMCTDVVMIELCSKIHTSCIQWILCPVAAAKKCMWFWFIYHTSTTQCPHHTSTKRSIVAAYLSLCCACL